MKLTRKITDKVLCLRSNFSGALRTNGLSYKLSSETFYRPNGFNSLYDASAQTREAVRHTVFFSLCK